MDRIFGLDSVSAHDEGLELLTTVYDPAELAVITSILEGEKIPYLAKDRGAGGLIKIVAGYSVFGTDIFVLSECLEVATALLSKEFELVEDEQEEDVPAELMEDEQND